MSVPLEQILRELKLANQTLEKILLAVQSDPNPVYQQLPETKSYERITPDGWQKIIRDTLNE